MKISFIFLFFTLLTFANDTDHAVKKTQDLLNDRKQVEDVIKANPQAKDVDDSVTQLTGSPEAAKELYAISADILPILMEMNQDNPEKALESLSSYSKNPGAFLKQLPPDIRLKIEKLAKKIEVKQDANSKIKSKP